jgi:putative DNA primase/helicase
MKMIDEALRYANAGIPVFPLHWIKQDGSCSCSKGAACECKGKHPRIKNWCEEATTDPDKIRGWWSKAPSANIGIPMGERSGLVTLDVDTRHGGDQSLEALVKEHGELPKTVTATTGGGGNHHVFKYTDDLALKNVVGFRDGLDVRTQGGMIVAAPSMHQSGKRYVWDEGISPFETQAAEMPDWLIAEIRKVGKKITSKKAPSKTPAQKIKEGGRNNHLASLAGALRRKGVGEEAILATLRAENADRLDPPLDDENVIAIAHSIARYTPEDQDAQFKLTDVGNAERFVAMFKDEVKYCAAYKKWFVWNGKYWEQDNGTIIEYAIHCVRSIYTDADMLPDGDRRKALIQHAIRSENGNKIKLLIALASGMREILIGAEDWDTDPMLLNCQNGTIDLLSGKLRPFRKEDYITRICSTEYDESVPTPLWTSLLETITKGDADLIHYMHKALGYALTGDTSEHALFVLYGTGRNGKSTFLNVFSKVMNTYAQSTSSETFTQKKNEGVNNDVARLKGARFVTAIAMEENKRLSEALIKAMTGGDKLVTRFLYGEYFEYVPQFKVFLAANHKPIIRDTTNSIWARIKLMPYVNTFSEATRDKRYAEKIMAKELPGILAWAVKGCLLWQKENIKDPPVIEKATAEYRAEMDSFAIFFEECCEVREGARVSNKTLRATYDEWCKDNGEYALTQRPFSQKLIEKGFVKKRIAGNGLLEWIGFCIRGQASRL